ncbi:hypothetical protein, partial [Streptomyces bohaiensis]|uniref:hypothetical protein n=1 Tax=Streptomyces bohaiensis TaxID=1431344 RepID=UPI003B79134E
TREQQDIAIEVFRYYEDRTHLLAPKADHAYRASRIGTITAEHIAVIHASLVDNSEIPHSPGPREELPNTEQLLYQLALDSDASASIDGASSAWTTLMVENALSFGDETQEGRLRRAVEPGSVVAGIMAEASSSEAHRQEMSAHDLSTWKKWTERTFNAGSDFATQDIPFAGTATAKILDEINAGLYADLEEKRARAAKDEEVRVMYEADVRQEATVEKAIDAALQNIYGSAVPDSLDVTTLKESAKEAARAHFTGGRVRGMKVQ